jgi:hypothetical protein
MTIRPKQACFSAPPESIRGKIATKQSAIRNNSCFLEYLSEALNPTSHQVLEERFHAGIVALMKPAKYR